MAQRFGRDASPYRLDPIELANAMEGDGVRERGMDRPPVSANLVHALAHVVAVPLVVLGLIVLCLSALSAGALMSMNAPVEATWLWPSVRWMVENQPLTVATWCLWLALPAALTVALVWLVSRRVHRAAWWRWAVLGAITHAAAFAAAFAAGWFPLADAAIAPFAAAGGFVIGLMATGWLEAMLRLVLRIAGRSGRARGDARGTRGAVVAGA